MSEPIPPSYATAINASTAPPTAFADTGYADNATSGAPAPGPANAAAYPPPAGYPTGAGYPATSSGTGYAPVYNGYEQPPTTAYVGTSPAYSTSPVPPHSYADSNPEAGIMPKDISPILSFDDKSIRLAFVRKVFAILGVQMLVTTGIICLFIFHEPTKNFVQQSTPMYISAYCLFLVLYIVLVCCKGVAKSYPANVILLGVFTLSLSYLVGVISSFHDTKIVLLLFGMTCIVSLAIMIFACQTKYDFTICGGTLFAATLCLLLFGLFSAALLPSNSVRFINIVYASLGALLFMVFLAFDTQLIMGGGKKYELSPEDYIFGALMLYVDIIYIFLFLLALFGGKN